MQDSINQYRKFKGYKNQDSYDGKNMQYTKRKQGNFLGCKVPHEKDQEWAAVDGMMDLPKFSSHLNEDINWLKQLCDTNCFMALTCPAF